MIATVRVIDTVQIIASYLPSGANVHLIYYTSNAFRSVQTFLHGSLPHDVCRRREIVIHAKTVTIVGVNATGYGGDTSRAIFGQPGTKYLTSPATSVKFLPSHSKRHGN